MATPYPRKRIWIADNQWTIFVVPPAHPKLGKGDWGKCQFADKEIYISNRLGRKNFKLTLTHELIHACHEEIKWDDRLVKKFTRSGVEKLVDRLAMTLVPFIAPKLFEIARKRGGRD